MPLQKSIGEGGEVLLISHTSIRPFKGQPRTFFDQGELKKLAESIRAIGQITPILVRKIEKEGPHAYELVDGQRRWHACKMAGKEGMFAIVVVVKDEEEQFMLSVVANFCREGHTPLETARAIKRIQDERGMSGREVASVLGRSEPFVYQHLSLLALHPQIQAMMEPTVPEKERFTFSVAVRLASLPHPLQLRLAEKIRANGLRMSAANELIRIEGRAYGLRTGNRQNPARDDYRLVRNFSRRIRRDAEQFLNWPPEAFTAMFRNRSFDEHGAFLRELEESAQKLQRITVAIRNGKASLLTSMHS